jgi:nitrate/nitrite transport system permease protein
MIIDTHAATTPAATAAEAPAATPFRKASRDEDPGKGDRRRKALQTVLMPLLALVVLGFLWEAYSQREGVTLPGPVLTVTESWTYIAHPFFDNGSNDKGLGWQLLSSLERVAQGYLLAAVIGVLVGILIGKVSLAYKALDPIFQVLRTIPPLAWLPLSLATFNEANPSAIFVIFITAIWPIIINTSVGVMRIPSDYDNVARVYQVRGPRYFFGILLPAAAPYIFTGLRIAIGMAWLAIVAAEMLTGGVGIGFFIWDSWNSSRMSDIVVSVIYVGLVGLLLDRLMALTARFFGTKLD